MHPIYVGVVHVEDADMKLWMEEFCSGLERALDAQQIFVQVATAARHLGFENCAYGMRHSLPIARPKFVLLNDYGAAWRQRYEDAGYLRTDPVVLHGARSLEPVVWDDGLFRNAGELWDEARGAGLAVGWSQSCFDACGTGGMLSLVRSHEPITAAELRAKQPTMRWLVNVAHVALSTELCLHDASPPPVLTAREQQVLCWTADGKTSPEIARILCLSENTVNYHFKRVLPKLGAATKASAVAYLMARALRD
ncbi:LuxR family transcriptional regulator [Variovorax sp.]|jgi:LuxR family transcriptional regulator|uniref:LuxR family transcriptional regulator n=1 Tax=Variovorax sp. TaxID=1871043 RepID=UPI0037D99C43